jgi:hypothetical protein
LALQAYFSEVDRLPGGNTVWICKGPRTLKARIEHKAGRDYSPEEIAASNIRPAGAVGGKAIVPRIVRGLELAEPIA